MKHIYFGQKIVSKVYVDDLELEKLKIEIPYSHCRTNYDRERLERDIENLKNNYGSRYVYKRYEIAKNDVFITEKDHVHICNIDDQVKLDSHQGKILNRAYDPTKDTMYYFTNIAALEIESKNIEIEYSEKVKEVLLELQMLYEMYYEKEWYLVNQALNQDEKGFWKRLFRL